MIQLIFENLLIGKVYLIFNQGLELYDYLDVIKHPMDLGTINQKLRDKKYKTVEAVLNDIQLIWDNCKLYNTKASVLACRYRIFMTLLIN